MPAKKTTNKATKNAKKCEKCCSKMKTSNNARDCK